MLRTRSGAALGALLWLLAAATVTHAAPPPSEWKAASLVEPADLAKQLARPNGPKPLLVHVGERALYKGSAIPGSRYAGPGQRPEGIAALRAAVRRERRDRDIVIYCGCCPWEHCPNVRPAYDALASMGFTRVRTLLVTQNFDKDWANAGYPVEKPKR